MKTIHTININNGKNEVVNAFMQLMVPHAVANEVIQREFKPQVDELQTQFARFAGSLENHRFSLLTEKVTQADTRRDKKWTAAKAVLVAELESPDAAHRAAAETVNKLFDSFGKIRNMGYAEQSGAMSSLCGDLLKNHAAELQLTNLTALIEDLQAANNAFVAAYDERTESMSEYKKNETREAKLALITAYRTLVFLLNARILQKGTDGLDDFINYANALIRQYRPMVGQKPAPDNDETLDEGLEDEEIDGDLGEEEEEEQTPPEDAKWVPVTFKYQGSRDKEVVREYFVGQRVTTANAPENDEGWAWKYLPFTMPDCDGFTIQDCLANEADDEWNRKVLIRWYNSAEGMVEQYYNIGETVVAPAPPAGMHWKTDIIGKPAIPMRASNFYPVADE